MEPARPMFNYFGSKWNLSKYYGPPRRDRVIEPFAGSACYSLYWRCRNVLLADLSPEVCAIWDFLINCSENDIRELPDIIKDVEHLHSIPKPAQLLIRRWLWALPVITDKHVTMNRYKGKIDEPRWQLTIWSRKCKQRLIGQKELIADWTVRNCSYAELENENAHWFVDPPYNNKAGKCYEFNCTGIDYKHLGEWCKSRNGTMDVCENGGADWLPFELLKSDHQSYAGHKRIEVVYREKDYKAPQLELL